jgi:hypothetical protein
MKKTLEAIWPVVPGALVAVLLFIGCAARREAPQLGEGISPVYESAEQIRAMPPCKAKVVERGPCYVYLEATNGKRFYLGSPGSDANVFRFLEGLKDGQGYKFPEVFLEHQRNRVPPLNESTAPGNR